MKESLPSINGPTPTRYSFKMLTFTLNTGLTINTRYIEQVGPVIWEEGLGQWSYCIILHRGEQDWHSFNDKRDAELNRERLIATIER